MPVSVAAAERASNTTTPRSLSLVVAEPATHEFDPVRALATADDLSAGMLEVVEQTRVAFSAEGVEWWAIGDDGVAALVAAAGQADGALLRLTLARTGVFFVYGGRLDPAVESELQSLRPIIRRRAAEERLATTAVGLARRNQALEDFAGLIAHELKTPLHAALVADNPLPLLEQALSLVDSLLEAASSEPAERMFASVAACLAEATGELDIDVEITDGPDTTLPLPPVQLRTILRNLLSNAAAAGARHIRVSAARMPGSWRLLVDDDGVGLSRADRYEAGSGLGLSLCRRIAGRFGGSLELAAIPSGGTRATLEFVEAG
jgi:signal transduction histidine kinase